MPNYISFFSSHQQSCYLELQWQTLAMDQQVLEMGPWKAF
jgi:hypothetical protein